MTPLRLLGALLLVGVVLSAAWWLVDEPTPAGGPGRAARAGPVADGRTMELPRAQPVAPVPSASRAVLPLQAAASNNPLVPELSLASLPADGRVTGQLRDPSGGPVSGEPVAVVLEYDPWTKSSPHADALLLGRAVSDEEGRFQLPARVGAAHVVLAGGRSWPRVRVTRVAPGDDLIVQLPPARTLEGHVLDADSLQPLPGAFVAVKDGGELTLARTDEEGAFQFRPVADPEVVGAYAPEHDIAWEDQLGLAREPVQLLLPAGREVLGTVRDGESSEPLEGARVRLVLDVRAHLGQPAGLPEEQLVHEIEALTDAEGVFRLPGAPSYGFVLHVSADGYVARELSNHKDDRLEADESLRATLWPVRDLQGVVLVDDGDEPAAGAQLTAEGPGGPVSWGQADADGRFTLSTADWDGGRPLTVTAADGEGRRGWVRVRHEDHQQVIVRVVSPLQLSVQVLSAGEPLSGAAVAALSADGPASLFTSGTDGRLDVVHPLAGPNVKRVRLQARHGLFRSLPFFLPLHEPLPEQPVVLDVQGGLFMVGRVTDPFGQPVGGARVRVAREAFARSALDGRFRVGPLEPDSQVKLVVEAEGYRNQAQRLPADSSPVDVVLEPVVAWAGRLVDSSTGRLPEHWSGRLEREVLKNGQLTFVKVHGSFDSVPEAPDEFRVELFEAGRYRLYVSGRDSLPSTSDVVAFDGVNAPPFASLLLFPAAVLELAVRDQRGQPVPGVALTLVPWEQAGSADRPSGRMRKKGHSTRSGADGTARFHLGQGGRFRLSADPGQWYPGAFVASPGPPQRRDISVGPSGDLVVQIRDERENISDAVSVRVKASGKGAAYLVSRKQRFRHPTDSLHFDTLPVGVYRLSVTGRRVARRELSVTVQPGLTRHEVVVSDKAPGSGAAAGSKGKQGGKGKPSAR